MPHGVVDLLEPVEIEQEHSAIAVFQTRGLQDLFQPFRHLEPVGQLGKRIEASQLGDMTLRFARLGQIGARPPKSQEIVELVEHRAARN